jgi:hypothetical protein
MSTSMTMHPDIQKNSFAGTLYPFSYIRFKRKAYHSLVWQKRASEEKQASWIASPSYASYPFPVMGNKPEAQFSYLYESVQLRQKKKLKEQILQEHGSPGIVMRFSDFLHNFLKKNQYSTATIWPAPTT